MLHSQSHIILQNMPTSNHRINLGSSSLTNLTSGLEVSGSREGEVFPPRGSIIVWNALERFCEHTTEPIIQSASIIIFMSQSEILILTLHFVPGSSQNSAHNLHHQVFTVKQNTQPASSSIYSNAASLSLLQAGTVCISCIEQVSS